MVQRSEVRTSSPQSGPSHAWSAHGFLSVPDLVPSAAVDEVALQLDDLCLRVDQLAPRHVHRLDRPDGQPGSLEIILTTELNADLRDTALYAAVRKQAAELLECEPKFFFDHLIRKPARTGTGTRWHQDRAYNLSEPGRGRVHFWIPMHDVDVDGGCMQFVEGSHNRGLLEHRPIVGDPKRHTLEAIGDFDAESTPVPLAKGGASMHHTLTLHKTGPNVSPVERTAWILQFVSPRSFREHTVALGRRFRPTAR